MGLFKSRKRKCEITFIEEYVVVIRGVKYHHHEHEFQEIKKLLSTILKNQIKMAATLADFKTAFAEINEATTNIAADIARLTEQLATGGMTDAEETDALNELKGIGEQLKAIAATTPDGTPTPPAP